jgi:hypothetical protein
MWRCSELISLDFKVSKRSITVLAGLVLLLAGIVALLVKRPADEMVMQEIEDSVKTRHPKLDLSEYYRFYLDLGNGEIHAEYVLKIFYPPRSYEECLEILSSSECKSYLKIIDELNKESRAYLEKDTFIPDVSDGGCGVILFNYNMKSSSFEADLQCQSGINYADWNYDDAALN